MKLIPQHFRLGNYLMASTTGEWMVVDELNAVIGATMLNPGNLRHLPDGEWEMTGIPLTAEILERSGFKPCSCKGWSLMRESYRFHVDPDFVSYDSRMTFVHELQNLFFAVTGKEVQICPPGWVPSICQICKTALFVPDVNVPCYCSDDCYYSPKH